MLILYLVLVSFGAFMLTILKHSLFMMHFVSFSGLMGSFVPCHMCFIASSMGESLLAGACVPFSNLILRTLLRGRHNIEVSPVLEWRYLSWLIVKAGDCGKCSLFLSLYGTKLTLLFRKFARSLFVKSLIFGILG